MVLLPAQAPDAANWESWVGQAVVRLGAGDVDAFVGAMRAVDALQASAAAGAPPRWMHLAAARLAWRGAGNAAVCARLRLAPAELLARAVEAAERGGGGDDLGFALLQLALQTADAGARRRMLEEATRRDLGSVDHGPWVLLAELALSEGRLDEAGRDLQEAAARLDRPGRSSWLVDKYHAYRAQEALAYGLLDVARQHLAAAGGLDRDTREQLWLKYQMAAEEFPAAIARGEAILSAGSSDDPAEVERLVAMAMFRELRVPLARDRRPLVRLQSALARPGTAATRARLLIDSAFLLSELAEYDAAAAALAEAATVIAGLRPDQAASLPGRLVTVRAYLALRRGADRPTLAALRADLLPVCDELLASWRKIPLRKGGIGFLQFAERRDAIAALVAVECALDPGRPLSALGHLMRAQAQGTLARRQDMAAGDPDQVQARLVDEQGGLLVFLPCMFGECLFVVTRARVEFLRMPRADSLLHQLRALHRLLELGDTLSDIDAVATCAAGIAEQILPPAVRQEMASWRECVIVGRELLGGLPFEVLPGPRSRWLGCDVALSYLPSLPFGLHRAAESIHAPASAKDRVDSRCALVAVTGDAGAVAEDRVDVPASVLDAIVSPWPEAVRLTGDAASVEALADRDVARSALTLLVAHGCGGLATAADERGRGVAMAGGRASCGAIEGLREVGVAPLVALAVCRGGSGPLRRGEDAGSHLAGAFLFAGADVVVAADADLDVAATMRLLEALSRARAAGCRAAEALRRARAELAATPEFAHPALHATLGVFGFEAGQPPVVARRRSTFGLMVAAAAVAAALGWLALRRRRATRA